MSCRTKYNNPDQLVDDLPAEHWYSGWKRPSETVKNRTGNVNRNYSSTSEMSPSLRWMVRREIRPIIISGGNRTAKAVGTSVVLCKSERFGELRFKWKTSVQCFSRIYILYIRGVSELLFQTIAGFWLNVLTCAKNIKCFQLCTAHQG